MTADTAVLRTLLRDDCSVCGHHHQPYVEVPRKEFVALIDEVDRLRHGVNHPYGGIDGCDRCAPEEGS